MHWFISTVSLLADINMVLAKMCHYLIPAADNNMMYLTNLPKAAFTVLHMTAANGDHVFHVVHTPSGVSIFFCLFYFLHFSFWYKRSSSWLVCAFFFCNTLVTVQVFSWGNPRNQSQYFAGLEFKIIEVKLFFTHKISVFPRPKRVLILIIGQIVNDLSVELKIFEWWTFSWTKNLNNNKTSNAKMTPWAL